MTVRAATRADARAIAEVRVASWRATYADIVPAAVLERMSADRDAAWIGDRIRLDEASGTLVVEAEFGGPVAGYALLSPCEDDDARGLGEVQAIYLRPDARGRGLGRALLEAAVARLADLGFPAVVLWVLTANGPARRFYEREGFVADGAARLLDFDGVPIQEVRYRRSTAARPTIEG